MVGLPLRRLSYLSKTSTKMLARLSRDLDVIDVIYADNFDINSCLASPKTCVKLKFESHDLDDKLLTANNLPK